MAIATTVHEEEFSCPSCGKVFDCSTGPTGSPSAGDASLCIDCGELHVYTDRLALRFPTEEERREILLQHPEIPELSEELKRRHKR